MPGDRIVITGGTGLIGGLLTDYLKSCGYSIMILGRKENRAADPPVYTWDYSKNHIDDEAISQADYIIHLAGAGIGDRRWTNKRKKEILESRTHTTRLLYDTVKRIRPSLKAFICSGAIGYYGNEITAPPATEEDLPGKDFLAKICEQWEESAIMFEHSGIRTVIIRTGLVLTAQRGILSKLSLPIKSGLGATLGQGKQFMPWIHIKDLCSIYHHAIVDEAMRGPYNAVSPASDNNKSFTHTLAEVLNKNIWLPGIPAFVFRFAIGEMSDLLLKGRKVCPSRLQQSGFEFQYDDLREALHNLYDKPSSECSAQLNEKSS